MLMVKAENVCKSFGNLQVLKNINLEVGKGEVVCIIGPSGSGKSTLLRCLNQLERITSGRIYIEDEIIDERGGEKPDKLSQKRFPVCAPNWAWFSRGSTFSRT